MDIALSSGRRLRGAQRFQSLGDRAEQFPPDAQPADVFITGNAIKLQGWVHIDVRPENMSHDPYDWPNYYGWAIDEVQIISDEGIN